MDNDRPTIAQVAVACALVVAFVLLNVVVGLSPASAAVPAAERDTVAFNYDSEHDIAPGDIADLAVTATEAWNPRGAAGPPVGYNRTILPRGDLVAPNGLPPLRQQYVDAVGGIDETVSAMRAAGSSAEDIARAAHAQRRAIGEQFKDLTPDPLRTQIFDRNVQHYGDPLGPSVDWLRDAGKSWDEIIESAARTGGQDLGF